MKDLIYFLLAIGFGIALFSSLFIGLLERGFTHPDSECVYATLIVSIVGLSLTLLVW